MKTLADVGEFGITNKQVVDLTVAFKRATECGVWIPSILLNNDWGSIIQVNTIQSENNLYVGYHEMVNHGYPIYHKVDHAWIISSMLYRYFDLKQSLDHIPTPSPNTYTLIVKKELETILRTLAIGVVEDEHKGGGVKLYTINQDRESLNKDVIKGLKTFVIKEWEYKDIIESMLYYYDSRKNKYIRKITEQQLNVLTTHEYNRTKL